jgi:hypothetical protein
MQLDVSSSFPPCIGLSRTSKIVKKSSLCRIILQYLAPPRYLVVEREGGQSGGGKDGEIGVGQVLCRFGEEMEGRGQL